MSRRFARKKSLEIIPKYFDCNLNTTNLILSEKLKSDEEVIDALIFFSLKM